MNIQEKCMKLCPLAARILIASLFLLAGFGLVITFAEISAQMAGLGVPIPNVLLGITIGAWLIGGSCILLGWNARLAAGIIFLIMIPVTLVFHAPWKADPAQFQTVLNHFLMCLAILGGLLYVVSFGAGPYSLEQGQKSDTK